MKFLLSIEHPSWAHQFKYMIRELEKKGHSVKVVAINKDRDLELLDIFNINYEIISNTSGKTIIDKGIIFLKTLIRIFQISKKFKPDIYIGRASPMMAINSFLFRKEHIIFEDTEHSTLCLFISGLFSDVIITPNCFKNDLGRKQLRFNAYKEIFYLHSNYFTPNPLVLSELNLSPGDKFFILRFVAWDAHHDIGQSGLSMDAKRKAVEEFSKYGRVLISSESPLPYEFERYRITISPEKIHDLLFFATLYFGEGGTMATESAVLGTPSIYVSSLVGTMGNFIELEQKYGLMLSYKDQDKAIKKAIELIKKTDIKNEWKKKQKILMKDKIDPTEFMTRFIENYPESFHAIKKYVFEKE